MSKDFDELMEELKDNGCVRDDGYLVFDSVEDLLGLLEKLVNDEEEDDEPDVDVEITIEKKEEEKPESADGLDELRKKVAKKFGDEHVKKLDKASDLAVCLSQMLRLGLPVEMETVKEYNEAIKDIFPDRYSDVQTAMMYAGIKAAVKELHV